jgi:uncharacterized protein YeaO (DUF488 family)
VDIRTKRIYEPAATDDGQRILVDRLWPRGVSRDEARLDLWLRDVAPSHGLRERFHADRRREGDWEEFCRLYAQELAGHPAVDDLLARVRQGRVTLLYASRDEEHNNAVALREYLRSATAPGKG